MCTRRGYACAVVGRFEMSISEYTVRGMTCAHCAAAVTEEVTKIPGVASVQVDVVNGLVSVAADGPLSTEAFVAAVEEAGYEVSPS